MRVVALILVLLHLTTWAESEISDLLDTARGRIRCASDPKCFDKTGVQRLLHVTSLKAADPEDVSMVLAHHLLHGNSSCTVQISRLEIVEEEVMRAIETEDIPGILRTFKRILKDGGKKECIGTEGIMKEMPLSSPSFTPMQWVRSVLFVLMEHVMKGHCLEDGIPPGNSLDTLFSRYGDICSPYMSAKGLGKMMHDLENTGNDYHHPHNHDHHDHHDHSDECDHDHDHSHLSGNHVHSGSHHDDHDHGNHDHDHDNHDHKHSDHDHSDHDHSDHDHSGHDLSKNDHSNHDTNSKKLNLSDHGHDYMTHNHDHDHSNHDHFVINLKKLNHSDHDTTNHAIKHDGHNHELINDNTGRSKNIGANKSDTTHSSDIDLDNQEVTIQIVTTNSNENLKNSNGTENETLDIEYKLASQLKASEKSAQSMESIVTARLSDLWQPTTLSSEESNVVSNILTPLYAQSSTIASQCLSAESIVSLYGLDRISISKSEFLRLCPTIVHQRVGEACADPIVSLKRPTKQDVYLYGTISVAVLCLASLSGLLLIPFVKLDVRHYIIAGFQGLAFSTMMSDALIHLLPEVLGLHSHDHSHAHSHSHDESFLEPYAQLLLGVFITTYIIFLLESILCALSGRVKGLNGHSHNHGHNIVHHVSEPTLISVESKSAIQLPMSNQSNSSLDTEIIDMDEKKKPPNLMVSPPVCCGMTVIALVVTFGDAVHNFGDGMAIGAVYSASIRGGLSTAVAALFHELPHELGDFAILLSSGLSSTRAMCINFASGLTSFLGLYLGIYLGENDTARQWIMAVTASTFLYIALAELIPTLRENAHGSPWKMLLVKNIGIVLGLLTMIGVSYWEHTMV